MTSIFIKFGSKTMRSNVKSSIGTVVFGINSNTLGGTIVINENNMIKGIIPNRTNFILSFVFCASFIYIPH